MSEIDFKMLDIFITSFLVVFSLMCVLYLCYLERMENKRIEESRRKRHEWREKRREGTKWEIRN